jgi:hypothetical protein
MELHPRKFQLLSTDAGTNVVVPDGVRIPLQSKIEYLGAVISADGDNNHELNRRIGMAKADFISLTKVWSHSSLTWKGKLRVFVSVVESKLLYGLSGMCLTKAQQRRLDGFQNRCVRKIVGIKPAFISRVPNVQVVAKADHRAAMATLRKRQLQLWRKVVRASAQNPMHKVCCIGNTCFPATDQYVRRIGLRNGSVNVWPTLKPCLVQLSQQQR